MSNHLSPQILVNKNGVSVTKHVKDVTHVPKVSRGFPTPVAPLPRPDVPSHGERLRKVLLDISTSADASYLDESIRDAKDDSLLVILEGLSDGLGPEEKSFRKALRAIVRMATPEAVEKHLRAAVVLKGVVRADILTSSPA